MNDQPENPNPPVLADEEAAATEPTPEGTGLAEQSAGGDAAAVDQPVVAGAEPATANAEPEPAAPAFVGEPRAEMVAALEAILFVAGEPMARERLVEVFDVDERPEGEAALRVLAERYQPAEGRGVWLEEVGGGLRLVSRPELHGYLRRFFQITGRARLSMAALETLAIIAYRQPLTGPEVAELRGVQSSTVIKTLLERRLIRIAGRKQVVGKPFLYGTTREFLLHFGLGTLADLPPLEEIEDFFTAEGSGEVVPIDREEQLALESAAIDERAEQRAADGESDEAEADAGELAEVPAEAGVGDGRE